MTKRTLITTVMLAIGRFAGAAAAQSDGDRLSELMTERYRWTLEQFPDVAMSRGDYSNADRVTDLSLSAVQARHRDTVEHLGRLKAIDRSNLSASGRLNRDLLHRALRNQVQAHRYRMFLAPIGGRKGLQQSVPQMALRVRLSSEKDYDNYFKRLEQVPAMVDATIELLKLGLAEGRTPPRVTLRGLKGQFTALIDEGALASALAKPMQNMPDHMLPWTRERLATHFEEESLPAVTGAMVKLRDFVNQEYVPQCRTSIAASDLPDGEAYYAFLLGKYTTTDLSAREVHELGLREVARIRAEMLQVIRGSDFLQRVPQAAELDDEALFERFIDYLRTDSRFYYEEPDALLNGYRTICKKVDPWLAKMFATLPRLPYGVKAIPAFMAPTQTTAYYQPGHLENAEPGWFYANTYALHERPRYEMIALAMHEAVPGHHLQIAIAQELDELPEFRKYLGLTVFVEGWALYAERLGLEMGLYDDPYDNFGRLLYEMWRACRLVVDPGIHALGWTREQAIAFMSENTALSKLNIENEVDRYIGWPGQATAYKIGELKFRELRERAQLTLGEHFDVRAFHDLLLGAGAVPLDVLERRVHAWITATSDAANQ